MSESSAVKYVTIEDCAGYVELLLQREAAPDAATFLQALQAQCASDVFRQCCSLQAADQYFWRGRVLLEDHVPELGTPQAATADLTAEMDRQGDLPKDTYIGILRTMQDLQCAEVSRITIDRMILLLSLATRNPHVVQGGRQFGDFGGGTFLHIHGIGDPGVQHAQQGIRRVQRQLQQEPSALHGAHAELLGLLEQFIPRPYYLA